MLYNRFCFFEGQGQSFLSAPRRIAPAHDLSLFSHTFTFTPADRLAPRFRTQFVPLSNISTGSGATFHSPKVAPAAVTMCRDELSSTRRFIRVTSTPACTKKMEKKIAPHFILCISSLSSSSVGKDVNVLVAAQKIFLYIRTSVFPTGSWFSFVCQQCCFCFLFFLLKFI